LEKPFWIGSHAEETDLVGDSTPLGDRTKTSFVATTDDPKVQPATGSPGRLGDPLDRNCKALAVPIAPEEEDDHVRGRDALLAPQLPTDIRVGPEAIDIGAIGCHADRDAWVITL
jgi:hypothetical protein